MKKRIINEKNEHKQDYHESEVSREEEKTEIEAESETATISTESSTDEIVSSGNETIEANCQQKIKDGEDKYLRLAAEFDNFKKRTAREFGELIKSANRDLLLQLLPIIDHFGLAMEAGVNANDSEPLQKGLALIEKDIKDFLSRLGIIEIESIGREFDPNIHEAIMQMPSDKYEDGIIIAQTQKGYILCDKILRPAKVIVSSGPSIASELAGQKEL